MPRTAWWDVPGPRPALLDRPRPYIMAHRGDSDHAPENTLAAFRLALESGADVIETDLWHTADGHLVCHHDATAERMTGEPRRIDDLSLAEVRRLVVNGRHATAFPNERIPTLDELLALVGPETLLALELKDPRLRAPEALSRLLATVDDRVTSRSVVFVSFDLGVLQAVKSVRADAPVGHITLRRALPTQPVELLGPYWPLVALNPWYVAMAHRRGCWVAPLDPDPHRRLPRYLRLGVDAVLTNDPAATRALLTRLRSG